MIAPFLNQWREELIAGSARFAASDAMVARQAQPLPPPELVRRVNSPEKADPSIFLRSGLGDLLAIVEALIRGIEARPNQGPPVPAHPALMELGCGVGRLLRHVPVTAVARVVATDVNPETLDWCRANLPGIEYHRHCTVPPIASLPAAGFDIIYAHSVFTHIPLERQIVWLQELERLLRPGGWLAATFLGREQIDALLDAEQRAILSVRGAIEIHPEWPPGGPGGRPAAYGAVCQTVAHQEAAFGMVFELCTRLRRPGRQDVVVLRRR